MINYLIYKYRNKKKMKHIKGSWKINLL